MRAVDATRSILGFADPWRHEAEGTTLPDMDRELEALNKTRLHVSDVAKLAEMTKGHLEGRLEDASACLRLIEQHAALGREGLGPLLNF